MSLSCINKENKKNHPLYFLGSFLRDNRLKETPAAGGLKGIYEDLLERLAKADITSSAEQLNLSLNDAGEAEVPLLGRTYLVSRKGVRRSDGQTVAETTGSVLIHYILNGSRSRPAGRFVIFSELAGPLFKQGSYATDALERPLKKRFQGCVPELLAAALSAGGRRGGEAGMGSVSLLFDLLPHLPLQLVFYDRDEEFPARATLLCDFNATRLIDFEVLAVLVTIFVQTLTKY
jgi:hypothetical protein